MNLEKFKHRTFCDGRIVMINADCFDVMRELEENIFDLILTDPPYNTTACDYEWDIFTKIDEFWSLFRRISKNVMIFTGSNPFTAKLICSNLKQFRYDWIWDKVSGANFANLRNRPFKTHENVMIFSKTPNFIFNPIRASRTKLSLQRNGVGSTRKIVPKRHAITGHLKMSLKGVTLSEDGKKHPVDIIQFSSRSGKRDGFTFPTRKSVSLFEYLINTYTNENDLVFDGFGGSFTTAIACIRTKRRFIGVEIDPIYFEKAVERVEAELKQGVLF